MMGFFDFSYLKYITTRKPNKKSKLFYKDNPLVVWTAIFIQYCPKALCLKLFVFADADDKPRNAHQISNSNDYSQQFREAINSNFPAKCRLHSSQTHETQTQTHAARILSQIMKSEFLQIRVFKDNAKFQNIIKLATSYFFYLTC